MTEKTLRVDGRAPRLRVKISGRRRAGNPVRVTATVSDGRGYGIRRVLITWGDKTGTFEGRSAYHRYRRGRYLLTVRAIDKAGNVTRHEIELRIRR